MSLPIGCYPTSDMMFQVPSEIALEFDRRMEGDSVSASGSPDYRKRLRFYLDFCYKYSHPFPGRGVPVPYRFKKDREKAVKTLI